MSDKTKVYYIAVQGVAEVVTIEETKDEKMTVSLTSTITNYKDDPRVMLPNRYELTDKQLEQVKKVYNTKLEEKYKGRVNIPKKTKLLILQVNDLSVDKFNEPEKEEKNEKINDVKKSIKPKKSPKIKPKNETREVIPRKEKE